MIDILLETLMQMDNNDITKQCMKEYNTSWNEVASCASDLRAIKRKQKEEDLREFLKANPWYKGSNWDWELYAQYDCSKVDSLEKGRITVCARPYYLKD